MINMNVLVTGSNGLIGSEAVSYYDEQGANVFGIDNNMRRSFFGTRGDTSATLARLKATTRRFTHFSADIRDQDALSNIFSQHRFDLIVHCAAQPSHDRAASIPVTDFEVNALGTLYLLEATRRYCPEAVFVLMSTNKVYGDAPNRLPLIEEETRWEYADPANYHGVDETLSIDQCLHSIFGASKVASDIMTQEYGRYYGLKTGIFRAGCLTGPSHAGVELHGFLNYLVKAVVHNIPYTIYGYKGKQVRDQIHSRDVIRAVEAFAAAPQPGEVFNLGGGRANSLSMLESIDAIEQLAGRKLNSSYDEQNRKGDHICYISDTRKFERAYPDWSKSYDLERLLEEMVSSELANLPK